MREELETLRQSSGSLSDAARERFLFHEGRPLLLADWERALFMHFVIEPASLQPFVPFALDLFDGRAFMSVVAFTMRGMRLARGGRLARWLGAPVAAQRFLNLRTYVRHGDESGIHFLAEWISHWLCVQCGPRTYGLPYRWGRLAFQHEHERGVVRGRVEARRSGLGALRYSLRADVAMERFCPCEAESLDEFLLERYIAFTQHGKRRRMFRIWHEPWLQVRAEVDVSEDTLLSAFAPWWRETQWVGANYSPGAFGIWMGPPRRGNSDL